MRCLAAVDLGASSGRVAVGRFDGDTLSVEEVHRFANVPVERRGRLRWDAERLRADVFAGLRAAARDATIDSVAVDSWAVDFGLLDARGELIEDPVNYRDARRAAAFERVLEVIRPRELYERTGIQLLPINTIFELAAMAADDDPALRAAARLLLVPDLFHHWLSGNETAELTNASTTQCWDVRAGDWARDLLARLDVPTGMLPDVVTPGTDLGPVVPSVADATGLDGTRVIATATHDTAAAVAAIPLREERSAYLSVGTWSLVGVEADEPVLSGAALDANLTNEAGVGGTYRVLRNLTGLWLLQESRRAWAAAGTEIGDAELVALAETTPPFRSLVDPNDPRFAEPGDLPSRIGEYCAQTGQEQPRTPGELARCILESLALKHAETVDLVAAVTGRQIDTLHLVGGGAQNPLLCAWTAAASARPVLAGPVEAAVLGNLLVQAAALGETASLAEGRELVRRSFAPTTYEPEAGAVWQEARGRFAEVVARAAPLGVGA